ncbi:MAG: hypothetical protein HON32_03130 [Francisellaceae bacterium]|jgi:hypothetical protein|nr:hypothetical protein [Francisellaceae bacterium]MBT6539029.1 hypothetical protein [Francisellaceae bacterium]
MLSNVYTNDSAPDEEALTATEMVFVKEYGSFAINLSFQPHIKITSLRVSSCHLLEIYNFDENGKTAFSLTHFTHYQLSNREIMSHNIKIVLNEFANNGGNISTAKIHILGGVQDTHERNHLRRNLKDALGCYVEMQNIIEPIDFWMSGERMLTDYTFSRNDFYWAKSEIGRPQCDVYSPNLQTTEEKQSFLDEIEEFYFRVSDDIESELMLLIDNAFSFQMGSTTLTLKESLSTHVVTIDGLNAEILPKDDLRYAHDGDLEASSPSNESLCESTVNLDRQRSDSISLETPELTKVEHCETLNFIFAHTGTSSEVIVEKTSDISTKLKYRSHSL